MTNMHRRTLSCRSRNHGTRGAQALSDPSNFSSMARQLTGNGEWAYAAVSVWGALPTGTTFGGTHGAIAQDKTGNI
jgi:hypothetical protein